MNKRILVGIFLSSLFLPTLSFSEMNDKDLHFWAGLGITSVTYVTYRVFNQDTTENIDTKRVKAVLIGAGVGTVVGAAKELIWDGLLKKGTQDLGDFTATAKGSAVGAVLSLGVDYLLKNLGIVERNKARTLSISINPYSKNFQSRIQIIYEF